MNTAKLDSYIKANYDGAKFESAHGAFGNVRVYQSFGQRVLVELRRDGTATVYTFNETVQVKS